MAQQLLAGRSGPASARPRLPFRLGSRSGERLLVTHRGLAFGLVASLSLFVAGYRLDTTTWVSDELDYRDAGWQYLHGDFHFNREHANLAKYLIGLSQVLLRSRGAFATRLPSVLASFFTGLVMFLLARRTSGFWTGLLAMCLWALLPRGIAAIGVPKIDRLAMLEPVMTLGVMTTLYFGWRWLNEGAWRWALLAGSAMGLAAASKITAVLVLPGVLLVPIVMRRDRRSLAQAAAAGVVAAATAAATYLPLGLDALAAIRYMFAFQASHGREGHPMVVAGWTYLHPPWWSLLWWQWLNYGTPATIAIAAAAVASGFVLARPVFWYVAAAIAGPFLYLSFLSGVKLPHYYDAWQAPLTLLCALSLGKLLAHGGTRRLGAIALLAPLLWTGIVTLERIATLQPEDYQIAAQLLRDARATGRIVVIGSPQVAAEYLPNISDSLHQKPRPTAVIDDRLFSGPFFGHKKKVYDGFLESIAGGSNRRRVGRLDVYVVAPLTPAPEHGP